MDRSLTAAATRCFGSSHNIRHDSFDTLMLTTVQYIYIIYILFILCVCRYIHFTIHVATCHASRDCSILVAGRGYRYEVNRKLIVSRTNSDALSFSVQRSQKKKWIMHVYIYIITIQQQQRRTNQLLPAEFAAFK